MLTSSQVNAAIGPVRFALAERAGLPDNCTFTGETFLPHGIFWGRVVEMPHIDPTTAKAPFITGIVCFRVNVKQELFTDTNRYVKVFVTFDGEGRPVASDAQPQVYQYAPTDEFNQPEHLIHDCTVMMQVLELAESKS